MLKRKLLIFRCFGFFCYVFILFFIFIKMNFAVVEINSCGEINESILDADRMVLLTQNLSVDYTCIVINASNFVFDGEGHWISYNGSQSYSGMAIGIMKEYNNNLNYNVSIQNINVFGFFVNFNLYSNNSLQNFQSINATYDGIQIGSNNLIENGISEGILWNGGVFTNNLITLGGSNNTVRNNSFYDALYYSIKISYSNNLIEYNRFNSKYIVLSSSDCYNNVVRYNVFKGDAAIWFDDVVDTIPHDNIIYGNYFFGPTKIYDGCIPKMSNNNGNVLNYEGVGNFYNYTDVSDCLYSEKIVDGCKYKICNEKVNTFYDVFTDNVSVVSTIGDCVYEVQIVPFEVSSKPKVNIFPASNLVVLIFLVFISLVFL